MNIDRLVYFASVVETRSLSKAAQLAGIAQGSMSKAIATLEDELGVKLLRREGRGIEVTNEGMHVYHLCAKLLDEFRNFNLGLRTSSPQSPPKKLRIATFEVFSTYCLAFALQQVFADYSALVLELAPGAIEDAIDSRAVDVGITYLPSPRSTLEYREVGSFELNVYGLKKWVSEKFTHLPFAIPTTSVRLNALGETSLDMWPKEVNRFVKYELELLETALQTTRLGLSVLYCPDIVVTLHNIAQPESRRLVPIPLPKELGRKKAIKIYLVHRKGDEVDVVERKFAKFFRNARARMKDA